MIHKIRLIIWLGIAVLTGTGCANQETGHSLSAPGPSNDSFTNRPMVTTPPTPATARPWSLTTIYEQLPQYWDDLEKKYHIAVMSSGGGADQIFMMIRSHGDVERKIPVREMAAIKESIFEFIGEGFRLELSKQDCCSGTGITGEITEIDLMEQRVLVVSRTKKNGNTDDPEANWIKMTDDGVIVRDGERLTFDKLAVGQEVGYWSTGLFLTSYPGQTSALKLEVVS